MKRILLIQPPVTRPGDFSAGVVRVSVFLPLGIAYLAAVIEKAGKHELFVLDALQEGYTDDGRPTADGGFIRYGLSDDEIAKKIETLSPDIVGVSCLFSAMQEDMVNVCRIAKRVDPNIVTIAGGAHMALMGRALMQAHTAIDYMIIGEAEATFCALIDRIDSGGAVPLPDGILMHENGTVVEIPKRQYIQDLDQIPFPARHRFDMDAYLYSFRSHGFSRSSPYTQMISSRGCPFKCAFCGLGPHWGNRQRLRSAENVLDEIQFLIDTYGVREIHFEDDNLTADRKRAHQLLDGMIRRGFNIHWHVPSGMAVNSLSVDLLEKMKASGCYSISVAVESGNQDVLTRLMRKPVNLKKVPALVRNIRKAGMEVRGFFIIGYPGETRQNIRETIEFAKRLELDWAYFSIASPLPNTPMWEECIEKGYIREADFDPIRSFHKSIIRTPEFSPEYLQEVREEAIIDTCFRNNPNLTKYDVDVAIENFQQVTARYPHFDFAHFYLAEAYRRKGDRIKAAEAYKKTLSINPSHAEALKRMAAIFENESIGGT